MSRTLFVFLLRCWLVMLLPALLSALCLGWLFFWNLSFTPLVVLMVALVPLRAFVSWVAYGEWRPSLWLWRVSRRVLGFCTLTGARVSLLFPTGLDETIELHELIRWAETDVDDLSQRFGIRLPRQLTVVLMSSHRDLTDDFGRPMAGTALMEANAVVLAADSPLRKGLRHELAHLFAFRWNTSAPHLVQEGLAVWLQGTTPDDADTVEPDAAEVIDSVLTFDADPSPMLDPKYFFAPDQVHASYALAGGFTGFLIRRFGWDHYRRFYSKVDRWTFRPLFQRQFGMSFEAAWRRCHDESVAMQSLNRRLQEDSLLNPML
jgi:hypothetical protein